MPSDSKTIKVRKVIAANLKLGRRPPSPGETNLRPCLFARVITAARLLWLHRNTDLFDWKWYRENNPDVADRTDRLFLHFCLFGVFQGRAPNGRYQAENVRHAEPVCSGRVTPLVYYAEQGYRVRAESYVAAVRPRVAYRGRNLGVIYFPHAQSNAYQRCLYRSLSACYDIHCYGFNSKQFTCETMQFMRKEAETLHLHWVETLCDPSNSSSRQQFINTVLSAKRIGYRVVWTLHNVVAHDSRSVVEERMLRRQLANLCDNIFLHGLSSVPDYLKGHSSKISMTKHGHYVNYYPDSISSRCARNLLNIPQNARVGLIFGKVRPYKNIAHLLREFLAACESPSRGFLCVAGKDEMDCLGKFPRHLREHPALRLDLQHIPDHEVQLYFRAADAVLIPAANILTSGVAVLAASFNKPVLAMRAGLLPETLQGLAADFSDSEEEFLLKAKDFFGGRMRVCSTSISQWQKWKSQNSWFRIVRSEPFVELFGTYSRRPIV
jgi:beta-1,4-mannosyltransferase